MFDYVLSLGNTAPVFHEMVGFSSGGHGVESARGVGVCGCCINDEAQEFRDPLLHPARLKEIGATRLEAIPGEGTYADVGGGCGDLGGGDNLYLGNLLLTVDQPLSAFPSFSFSVLLFQLRHLGRR